MKRLYGFYDMKRSASTISFCDSLGFENIQSATMNSLEQLLRNYTHEYLYHKFYTYSLSTTTQDESYKYSPGAGAIVIKKNDVEVEVDLLEESLSGKLYYIYLYNTWLIYSLCCYYICIIYILILIRFKCIDNFRIIHYFYYNYNSFIRIIVNH